MKEELLYRYLTGRTSEAENDEILAWLDADPEEHLKEMNRIRYICQAADHDAMRETSARRGRPALRRIAWYASGAAASLLLLVGIWHMGSRNAYRAFSDRMAVVEVPAGQYIRMTLEDGTGVWLNAGTRLEYPAVFDRTKRRVKVSGEAIFDVTHDARRPFVVETFASQIEVLGTRFDVCADERNNLFSTTLMEGRVKVVDAKDPAQTIFMEPNDVVRLVGGQLRKSRTSDFADMCWTEGLIRLKPMPFDQLMAQFQRAFDVRIELACETLPVINVISGEIRVSDGIEHALDVLKLMSDFSYERDYANNIITIKN